MYFSFETQAKYIFSTIECVITILNGLKTNIAECLALALPPYTLNAEWSLDCAEDLNWNMAYERHILDYSHRSIVEQKTAYERVTPERLMAVSCDLFTPDNAVLTLKTKKKKFNQEEARRLLLLLNT
jgi:hypothetical protein